MLDRAGPGHGHGAMRVIAVDGRSGSGKSTLAAALVERLRAAGTDVALLSMEGLYRGWDGLDAGAALLARAVLVPLAAGDPGSYEAWDWQTDGPGSLVVVAPADVLVIDGVGSGAASAEAAPSTLVWVSAPTPLRKARALARDGATYAPYWDAWAQTERDHHVAAGTRERADVVVELA